MLKYYTCKHKAWNENCPNCMLEFKTYHASEIKKEGLDSIVSKYKRAGYFM